MDLTPQISVTPAQLNAQMRRRACAVLQQAGIESLDALGNAYWADILFVTSKRRESLEADALDALGKAAAGLGYSPAQYALLSDADALTSAKLNAYLDALSCDLIVFLERNLAESDQTSIMSDCVTVVQVSDFFAALEPGDDQQKRKQEAWGELLQAKRKPAMR
ncbi:MAG: hypothetical protein FWE46_02460 [Coriobacteriia bacterium]|nr:hypothetical protein [Coriobacteriia bacterium]MCL2537083.1 hypothetical protein [Coriobacteriia bacterium]